MKGRLSTNLKIAIIAALLVLSSGCSKRFSDLPAFSAILPFQDAENRSVGRFKTTYLSDQIHAYFQGNVNAPIAVTTFVDVDNLEDSSTFGRVISEQLISELSMKGYKVLELRHSESMHIAVKEGEFALSRELKKIRRSQNLGGVVVGTYVVSPERVYINTRLLNPTNSTIISAGSVEMPITDEIKRLVRRSTLPPVLERIPVKQLHNKKKGKMSQGSQGQMGAVPNPGDLQMKFPPQKGNSSYNSSNIF